MQQPGVGASIVETTGTVRNENDGGIGQPFTRSAIALEKTPKQAHVGLACKIDLTERKKSFSDSCST
jgi:hypothetical protein